MGRITKRLWLLFAILFVALAMPIGFAWADSNFQYRMPITVTETSGSSLTDYQVKITVDTASLISAGKMSSDCSDIRIFDSDDTTQLNYWIEDGTCNTANTIIWVKVPSLTASSSKTIYMYYGNPSATSASSIDNTFIFGDDFNDGSLDTGKWNNHGGVTEATSMDISATSSSSWNYGADTTASFARDVMIVAKVKWNSIYHTSFGFSDGGWWGVTNVAESFYIDNTGAIKTRDYDGSGDGSTNEYATGQTISVGAYREFAIGLKPTGADYYVDGTLVHSTSTYTVSPTHAYFNVYGDGSSQASTSVDWMIVRKYASSEPTTTVGAEETNEPSLIFKRPITINETSGTSLTDYQVKVTVDTASLISQGKLMADCSDIRFFDTDGSTQLNYWIEDGTCNTANTNIWIRTNLSASASKTIYMYYGVTRTFTIQNNEASDLTNYQVKLPISGISNTAKLVINRQGVSETLSWWSDGEVVWVKIPTLPASSTITLEVTADDTNGISGDGSSVFDYFADFESGEGYNVGDLNGQNGWSGSTIFDVISDSNAPSGSQDTYATSSSTASYSISKSGLNIGSGILHISIKQAEELAGDKLLYLYFYNTGGGRFAAYQMYGNGGSVHRWLDSGNWHSGSTYNLNQWYDMELWWRNSDDKIRYFIDGNELTSGWTGTYGGADATMDKITLGTVGATNYYDKIYIRKYTSSEPTVTETTGVTSKSSIDNTFIFGDDFNDGTLDTSKWIQNSVSPTFSNGNIRFSWSSGTTPPEIKSTSSFSPPFVVEYKIQYITSGDADGTDSNVGVSVAVDPTTTSTKRIYHLTSGGSDYYIDSNGDGTYEIYGNYVTTQNNVWYDEGMKITPTQTTFFRDSTTTTQNYGLDTASYVYLPLYVFSSGSESKSGDLKFDFIFIRKYASSEPTTSVGAEETNNANTPPTITINSPTEGQTFEWSNNESSTIEVPIDITTSDAEGDNYTCTISLDGSQIATLGQSNPSYSSTYNANWKSDGNRTITVNCDDGTGTSTATVNFRTVQKITIRALLPNGSYAGKFNLSVAEYSPNGWGVGCSYTWKNLGEFENETSIYAEDYGLCWDSLNEGTDMPKQKYKITIEGYESEPLEYLKEWHTTEYGQPPYPKSETVEFTEYPAILLNVTRTPQNPRITDTVTLNAKCSELGVTNLTITFLVKDSNLNATLLNTTTQANATAQYSLIINNAHHSIYEEVVCSNSGNHSTSFTDTYIVANSMPTQPSVTATPSEAYIGDTIIATAENSTDADGDALTYEYKFVDATTSSILQDWGTANNYPISFGLDGHNITIYARANDGYDYSPEAYTTVYVYSKAPEAVISSPLPQRYEIPMGEKNLSIEFNISTSDPEGNAFSCNVSEDGTVVTTLNETSPSYYANTVKMHGFRNVSVECVDEHGNRSMTTVNYSVEPYLIITPKYSNGDVPNAFNVTVRNNDGVEVVLENINSSYKIYYINSTYPDTSQYVTGVSLFGGSSGSSSCSGVEHWQFYDINTSATPNKTTYENTWWDTADCGAYSKNVSISLTTEPPTINSISYSPTNPHVGETIIVTVDASSVYNDTISYTYEYINNNDSTTAVGGNTYTIQQSDVHDNIIIRVTATNSYGDNSTSSTSFVVANTPPTLPSISVPQEIYDGFEITAVAENSTDADGDTVTYEFKFVDYNTSTTLQDWSANNTYYVNRSLANHTVVTYARAYDGYDYSPEVSGQTLVKRYPFTNMTITVQDYAGRPLVYTNPEGIENVPEYFVDSSSTFQPKVNTTTSAMGYDIAVINDTIYSFFPISALEQFDTVKEYKFDKDSFMIYQTGEYRFNSTVLNDRVAINGNPCVSMGDKIYCVNPIDSSKMLVFDTNSKSFYVDFGLLYSGKMSSLYCVPFEDIGKIYCVGGYDITIGTYLYNTIHEIDVNAKTDSIKMSGSSSYGRRYNCDRYEDTIYCVDENNKVYRYNTTSNSWTQLLQVFPSNTPYEWSKAAIVVLDNETLYVAVGLDNNTKIGVYLYNYTSGSVIGSHIYDHSSNSREIKYPDQLVDGLPIYMSSSYLKLYPSPMKIILFENQTSKKAVLIPNTQENMTIFTGNIPNEDVVVRAYAVATHNSTYFVPTHYYEGNMTINADTTTANLTIDYIKTFSLYANSTETSKYPTTPINATFYDSLGNEIYSVSNYGQMTRAFSLRESQIANATDVEVSTYGFNTTKANIGGLLETAYGVDEYRITMPLAGIVISAYDEATLLPVSNATITILDENGNVYQKSHSFTSGSLIVDVGSGINGNSFLKVTTNTPAGNISRFYYTYLNSTMRKEIIAYIPETSSNIGAYTFQIYDSVTQLPIEGATVLLKKYINGKLTTIAETKTSSDGKTSTLYALYDTPYYISYEHPLYLSRDNEEIMFSGVYDNKLIYLTPAYNSTTLANFTIEDVAGDVSVNVTPDDYDFTTGEPLNITCFSQSAEGRLTYTQLEVYKTNGTAYELVYNYTEPSVYGGNLTYLVANSSGLTTYVAICIAKNVDGIAKQAKKVFVIAGNYDITLPENTEFSFQTWFVAMLVFAFVVSRVLSGGNIVYTMLIFSVFVMILLNGMFKLYMLVLIGVVALIFIYPRVMRGG